MRSFWLIAFLKRLPGPAKNIASKLAGESGVRASSFLFIFILARRLGAGGFGLYSTLIAYASLFNIAIEIASTAVITREVARRPQDGEKIVCSAHALKAALAILALLGIHFVARWTAFAGLPYVMIDGFGFVIVSYSLIDYAGFLLAGRSEMRHEATLRAACRSVIAAGGIGCLIFTRSLSAVALTMCVSSAIALLIAHRMLRRRFQISRFALDWSVMRSLLVSSVPLLAAYAFSLAYDNQDLLLLKHFGISDQTIGFYGSANKVLDVLKVVPFLLAGAFFPGLAKAQRHADQFRRQVGQLAVYALLFAPPIVLAGFFFAPWIEQLLYGRAFVAAAPLLRLLMIAYAGIFVNYLNTYILIAGNFENRLLLGAAAACAINFYLCWRLIPTHGAYGVCFALIATEGLYLIYQTSLVGYGLLRPKTAS